LAIEGNFPDPALFYANDTWHAVATNNAAGVLSLEGADAAANSIAFGQANVQMATSTDFIKWTLVNLTQQPLPTTGAWAQRRTKHPANEAKPLSSTWAPALIKRDDGKYVMYYSATWTGEYPYAKNDGRPTHPQPHCVGAAVSDGFDPNGPYEPLDEPLACPIKEGGAIDPEAIRDVDGSIWVTWKVDGNNIGRGGVCGNTFDPQTPTPIMIQKMQADGVTAVDGTLTQILDRTDADGPLVEAPALVRTRQGKYFLFFSSGCTRSSSYSVKYAVADKVTGPYVRANETLLSTGMYGLEAPG
ncbi:glycoside hydrolase family 43 protein, partial [Pseudocercospora fijiensis CIRAD86]